MDAIETVARDLNVEEQFFTVDKREFIKFLALRYFHQSKCFEPEGPHVLEAQITDKAGRIIVRIATGSSDNVLGLEEFVVNEIV